jgi:hypothetical protein
MPGVSLPTSLRKLGNKNGGYNSKMSFDAALRWLRRYKLEALLFLLIASASLIGLDRYPPVWWDEGWTLMVARNWVEQGHYGLYQDGLPRDAGLAGHFPMVALVSLSFRLFGVGVWQGRLPAVLASLGTLALLYSFSYQWWGRKVALGTVIACLLLAAPQVNIINIGRQTMGEIPALFFLLAGYACLDLAFKHNRFWLLATTAFWGICIAIKTQPLPFWIVSVIFYTLACLIRRQWRNSGWVVLSTIAAIFVYRLLGAIPAMLTQPGSGIPSMVEGLMGITGLVLDKNVRWLAVVMVINYGLPTLLGLTWTGWQLIQEARNSEKLIHPEKWAIWGFASSWFAWYLLLGTFWVRYLLPAVVISGPFIAASLSDLTRGYDLKWVVRQSARLLTGREMRIGFQAIFCLLLITLAVTVNLKMTVISFQETAANNPQAAARKLQEIVPANAVVETYESEIMFLAPEVRFHFPPDETSVKAIERGNLDPGRSVGYDPLKANPDYLLVGIFGWTWGIYNSVIDQGSFKLQESFNGYQLYSRVR